MLSGKKIARIFSLWLVLFVFALLSASAIAEGEVLEEYRYLVYLGTVLAMVAFAVAVCCVWLGILTRLQGKLRRLSKESKDRQLRGLGRLLAYYRSRSFRSLVSLHLIYAYLCNGQSEKAFCLLCLQTPDRSLFFDHKAYAQLFCVCAAVRNDQKTFDRFYKESLDLKQFSFLDADVLSRVHEWQRK